jgi:ParB/RepB/Spo0J family partition protein
MPAPKLNPDPRFELVPLARLVESPANHRKKTWGAMDELIESVRAKGVLQPILVRPVKGIGSNLLEIVFGHRRFRAAREAGLEAIPAVIRELSDVDALEANVIENLQRSDVHPLEEAEGYEQLLRQQERPYTVADIAAKVGKSKEYVYGRMKLLALCPAARKAFYEGTLTPSTALLLARIPVVELQEKALAEVVEGGEYDFETDRRGPMSFRQAQEHIVEKYTLRLTDAPFKRDDAELVSAAGACTTCPKRSGAQPELFADVKSADVCTDPTCFAEKKKADWKRTQAAAKEKGLKLLTDKDARGVFDQYNSTGLRWNSPFVKLTDKCADDPKRRTWKQLLGADAPEKVLGRDQHGKVHELVDKAAAAAALKKAGHKFEVDLPDAPTARVAAGSPEALAARRGREQEAKLQVAIGNRVAAALVAEAERREPDAAFWQVLAAAMLSCEQGLAIQRRLGRDDWVSQAAKDKYFAGVKGPAQLRGLVLELALEAQLYEPGTMEDAPELRAALKWAGIDRKKIAAAVKAETTAAGSGLLSWTNDAKNPLVWIGKGSGCAYEVTLDGSGGGYSIRSLKPGGAQTGSMGRSSPTGSLDDAKAACEEHAISLGKKPAKKGGRRG